MSAAPDTSDIVQALADQVEAALGEIADQPTAWIHRAVERAVANTGYPSRVAVLLADPDLMAEYLREHADEFAADLRRALPSAGTQGATDAVGTLILGRLLAVARGSLLEEVLAELTHRQDTAEERAEKGRYYDGADALYDRSRDEPLTSQPGCVSPEDAGVRSVGPA